MKYYNPKELGKICRYYRKNYTTYTQADIGAELFYTEQAIGHFERGVADTAFIFQWYVKVRNLYVRFQLMGPIF